MSTYRGVNVCLGACSAITNLRMDLRFKLYPVDHLALVLDQDGDVHEHLMQLLDALLQLDEHLMSLLDVVQSLPQLVHVALDLDVARQPRPAPALQTRQYRYYCTALQWRSREISDQL